MSRHVTFIGWDEVPHLSEADKAQLFASYLPHERDARTRGIPSLGAGAIYPIDESEFLCDPIVFPAWYRHAYALDVGWNRTAALWGAHDPEDDILYVYGEYYRGQAEPSVHAAAIQARGEWIPGVVDPASRSRSQRDGDQLFWQYGQLGLKLTPADNKVTGHEGGILAVWQRLSTGRIKVFRHLQNFLGEYRIYRRNEKGAIVKEADHLLDCLRYLVMSGISVATLRPFDEWTGRPGMPQLRRPQMEAEHDPFAAARNVVSSHSNEPKGGLWQGIGGWDRR